MASFVGNALALLFVHRILRHPFLSNDNISCHHHNFQGPGFSIVEDVAEVKKLLEKEIHMRKEAEEEVNKLKSQLGQSTDSGVYLLCE